MAHLNRAPYRAGYDYSNPNSPQLFPVESTGWGNPPWTTLYEDAPSIESANSSAYAPTFPTIPVGGSSRDLSNMFTGAAQPILLSSSENWRPQNIFHPDPLHFHHSPSFASPTSSSTLQSPIPNTLSPSTNPQDYTRVPQRQYALTAHHFTPANPILFNVDSGEPGIRLTAALNRRFTNLRDRDDLVFESSRSPTITMRLEWPGYMSWSRQVRILDSRRVRQSISREKLAFEVAKTVSAFIQPQVGKRISAEGAPDRDRMWGICDGNLDIDDLVLVCVENVSKGSWQPQFLVRGRHRTDLVSLVPGRPGPSFAGRYD